MRRMGRACRGPLAALLLGGLAACGGSGDGDGPGSALCGDRAAADGGPAWAREGVFYEVFVRSFVDSDGDGIGDLPGLISRLDYLNDGRPGGSDLGVDGLWLMPIFGAASYHGYDTVDYESIDPAYGTLADFQRLVAEAHARGMRILLDLVVNHTSSEHPWFVAAQQPGSPLRDYYVWRADDPGWTQPWSGSPVWHAAGGSGYYYGVFWSGMPDLNYGHAAVRDEMQGIARLWLDRGADGFRLDAVRFVVETGPGGGQQDTPETHAFWKEQRRLLKQHRPDVFLLGEAWADAATISDYYGAGADEFDATFDFPLQNAIVQGVQSKSGAPVREALCTVAREYPTGVLDALFLGNHDLPRVGSRLDGDTPRLRLAATALLTLPGAPFVYYGDEIGMRNGALEGGDVNYRTPMLWSGGRSAGFTSGTPWLPVNAEAATVNVQSQLADEDSLLAHYRRLIALRRAHEPLRRGALVRVPADAPGATDDLLGYARTQGGGAVIVVLNFGGSELADVELDLGATSVPAGAVTELLGGRPAAELTPANRERYPAGAIEPYGARLLAVGGS